MRKLPQNLLIAVAALLSTTANAASRAQLVEAYAQKEIDKSIKVWIAPTDERQAADPTFQIMKTRLREVISANGFKVGPERSGTVAVTMQYSAGPSGAPASHSSSVYDPSYRLVLITGYDVAEIGKPKVVWQTMMEEYGISNDVRTTIPGLLRAAGPYLGVAKTPQNALRASWCAGHPNPIGSHIPVVCTATTIRPLMNMSSYVNSFSASEPISGATPSGPR